ncbi:prolipoprotein diacylglyceryl transferase [Synechococcus sp. M16CYN]|uniref:prolipoprotein diacylglyceryl transferase n=1 Tax=Synechococcus sp. M16CYN TaxID=3103139 RepID=UPI0032558D8A
MFISPGPELFQFGPLVLRWYGLLIALAILIGLSLSSRLAQLRKLEHNLVSDLLPALVLFSIVGARVYYVAFEWHNYAATPLKSFAIWEGGIAIHGALVAGILTLIFFCRKRHQPFWEVFDILVPSVAFGQALGRWGNFFNSEAFGVPTNLPWKLFIPISNRPLIYIDSEFFHPTFLYESFWNLFLFTALILIFRWGLHSVNKLPAGMMSCLYLIGYSLGRVWIEGLRIDPLCIGALPPTCEGGIRIAQLMSVILAAIGCAGFWWLYGQKRPLPDPGSRVN